MEATTERRRTASIDRRQSLRERAGAAALRLNLPLVAIVAAGFALTAYFTLKVTGWAIMTDELQHVKLAESIADTLNPLPRVRGEHLGAYGQLYPLLTAPAYGLFDMPTAFKVVHGLNALIMASAAIPAYLLTRSVVGSRGLAWLVAALTVAVPWMGMAHVVMTEVAGYPAFTWGVFAIYNAVVSPRPRNDVLALAAIAIAALARTQFLCLAAILPATVVTHEFLFALREEGLGTLRSRLAVAARRSVREHIVLASLTGITLVAYPLLSSSGVLDSILGNYAVTVSGNLFPDGAWVVAKQLWGITGVAVGIVPVVVAAGWALSAVVRPSDKRGHAFSVLLILVAAVLSWQVSSFLVRFAGGGIQDRYFFFVVPLLFVGMAAALRDPRPRLVGLVAATGVFAWLTTTVDFTPSAPRAFWGSPPVSFNTVLSGRSYELGHLLGFENLTAHSVMIAATIAIGLVLALILWRMPRRITTVAVGAAVLLFCVGETAYTNNKFAEAMSSDQTPLTGRSWVDAYLPHGDRATILPGGVNATATDVPVGLNLWATWGIWWNVEFWNEQIDRAANYEDDPVAVDAPFGATNLHVDENTGNLGAALDRDYVVVSYSDVRQRLAGESVHVDGVSGLELIKPSVPLRLDWMTQGIPYNGVTTVKQPVTIRLFAPPGTPPGRRRLIVLMNVPVVLKKSPAFTLSAGGHRVRTTVSPSGTASRAQLNVCVKAPFTDVVLSTQPSPRDGPSSASLHVAKISAGPSGRPC